MNSIKIEKINAIKIYKRNQLLKNIFLNSFTLLACLFYSSPFWFPFIASSMKALLLVHVPKLCSLIFNSKFVFIVANMIIVALIRESKIFPSNSSASPTNTHESYYEEYITTKKNLQKFSAPNIDEYQKKDNQKQLCVVKTKTRVCEDHKRADKKDGKILVNVDQKRVVGTLGVVVKKLEGFDGKKNQHDLSLNELKKRSDDFIAGVNKRWVFEAREFLCDV